MRKRIPIHPSDVSGLNERTLNEQQILSEGEKVRYRLFSYLRELGSDGTFTGHVIAIKTGKVPQELVEKVIEHWNARWYEPAKEDRGKVEYDIRRAFEETYKGFEEGIQEKEEQTRKLMLDGLEGKPGRRGSHFRYRRI